LAPLDPDWFYIKAAAVCRQIYINKSTTLGIGTLRSMFGKKKRGSVKSPRFTAAGGKVLRTIVKQLKAAKYLENKFVLRDGEKAPIGLSICTLGITELDKVASKIIKSRQ
jgi:small subunit ribosomal protein S19e